MPRALAVPPSVIVALTVKLWSRWLRITVTDPPPENPQPPELPKFETYALWVREFTATSKGLEPTGTVARVG